MKHLKNYIPFITLLAVLIILLGSCEKKISREEQVETLTTSLIKKLEADSIQSYIEWMEGMGTRFALAENRRQVAVRILNRFRLVGVEDVRLDSFMIYRSYRDVQYNLMQYNVIATIEGNINPSEVYIIGGHYDSILRTGDPWDTAPGANDNASGVAAAIEVARVMMDNDFKPASTIEFVAFAAEELGLYGSRSYASRSAGLGKDIALMLNNDMIAYEQRTDPNTWLVNIMDYENSIDDRLDAQRMADRYTVLNTYTDNTYQKYSDSYAFFENDYPAIFFFIGSDDPNYHTLNDLAANCNFEYCKEVTSISLSILIDKTY